MKKPIAEIKGQSKSIRLIFAEKQNDIYIYYVTNKEGQTVHAMLDNFNSAVKYACEDLNLIKYIKE